MLSLLRMAGASGLSAIRTHAAHDRRVFSSIVSRPPMPGRVLRGIVFRRGYRRSAITSAAVTAPMQQTADQKILEKTHGFSLVEKQYLKEYDSIALLYRHDKTGAQCLSLLNNDENKTFGVTFRTPVSDSKGTPHILEHSVLCGSDRYPIKEPFVELMKGSLNTFLNAFTYPDRTCYPVASTNLRDYYNLVNVYLDSVLHPVCVRDGRVFAQEGWHWELESPEGELGLKGVVFNEMKGVYSSPDALNGRACQRALHPDSPYAYDSGGDPEDIPSLTYDEFREFYGAFYHPSNARFWFYGDDDANERLRLLGSYLDAFDRREVDSVVRPQPLLEAPRRVVEYYPAAAAELSLEEETEQSSEQKAFVSLNWVLSADHLDLETELALGFLNALLLGTAASPLRKALNDSGLGESIIGGGLEDEMRQPTFCVGLKGVSPENAEAVEKLILVELARLAGTGFTASATEAALNSIEFALRENNTGHFPRGLSLMLRALGSWVYDRDPLRPLRWEEDLANLKSRLGAAPTSAAFFGPLIHKYLLDNTHRVAVHLLPDKKLGQEIEQRELSRIEAHRAAMSEAELGETVAETHALLERQETPDPPEALACIPSLHLSDIPKEITTVPTTVEADPENKGISTLRHDLFTNDILYLDIAFDLAHLPADLLPLVPLFSRSLTNMGTSEEDFVSLTERIGCKTGGVSISPFVSARRGTPDSPVGYLLVRGKAMREKVPDMIGLLRDILLSAKLDDRQRFRQMVLETRAALEAGVVGSGHSFAAARLDAQLGVAGAASEIMGGASYLNYIRSLSRRVEEDWEGVQRDLEFIRKALLQRQGALVNLTGDERVLAAADTSLDAMLFSQIPQRADIPTSSSTNSWASNKDLILPRANEALLVPTQVNYVAKAADVYSEAGYQLSGSSYVISKYLGTSWIWDRVRVSGGAYGGFCDFDSHSGVFTYSSYRDPNLLKTVDVYDGTVDFLSRLELSEDELTKAIIGTIGDVDAYQLPDAKGRTAFMRHILGVTDEERQRRRDEILATSIKDFREFGEVLASVRDKGKVVAVTSAEKAAAAEQERPGFFENTLRLL